MKQKTKKASILAFTLVMMGILLAAGLSLMGATIVDQKVALESGDSVQALQNAESGTEVAVSVLSGNFATDESKDQLSEVFESGTFRCEDASGTAKITKNGDDSYELTFYKENASGDEVEVADCGEKINEIVSVKSVGTNQNTTRAVQVALAAGCECGQLCLMLESNNNVLSSAERDTIVNLIKNDKIFPESLVCESTLSRLDTFNGVLFYREISASGFKYSNGNYLDFTICTQGFDVYGIKACNP